jgi:hypothetical protein
LVRLTIILLPLIATALRLSLAGSMALPDSDSFAGRISDLEQLDELACRFTYDGLGRLTLDARPDARGVGDRATARCRTPSAACPGLMRKETPVSQGITALQRKDFFYDGVRRIQEVVYRPNVLVEENLAEGAFLAGGGDGAKNDELAVEMTTLEGDKPDQQIVEDAPGAAAAPGPAPPEPTTWTDREYVYGPDYVDEIIAQIPPAAGQAFAPASARGPVMYVLQDANYNVVALVATNGNLLEQYAYEPYGTLAARDDFGNHAVNRVGHQGLFFERFDGTYADGTLDIAPPGAALGPIGIGLYFARNRFYGPGIGRWTTADPNETGLPIVAALAMNGSVVDASFSAFDSTGLYWSGFNLYHYERSNPTHRTDALGLYDDFDESLDELIGNRLYTLGMLNEGARVASIGLNLAMDIAVGMLPGSGIHDAFNSIALIANGQGGFWDVLNVVSLAVPAAGILNNLGSLRAISKSRRYRSMHCNCFVEGTPVDTPEGPRAIQSIEEGDRVLTRSEVEPCQAPTQGRVTGVFRSLAPAILWLTFSTGQVIGTTPGHEVWTERAGWTYAGLLKPGDALIDRSGNRSLVREIHLELTPKSVYNLEVESTHTFFVDGLWVHNNSCPIILPLDRRHGGALHTSFGTSRARQLQAMGMQDVRWNQTLVNSRGENVSSLRPDIQYIGPDGKVHIEEVVVTNAPDLRRRSDFEQLLGPDFGSYLEHYP